MNLLRLTIMLCSLFATSAALALQTSLDRIMAIVDESVITERDLSSRIELIKIDFNRSSRRLPSEAVSATPGSGRFNQRFAYWHRKPHVAASK